MKKHAEEIKKKTRLPFRSSTGNNSNRFAPPPPRNPPRPSRFPSKQNFPERVLHKHLANLLPRRDQEHPAQQIHGSKVLKPRVLQTLPKMAKDFSVGPYHDTIRTRNLTCFFASAGGKSRNSAGSRVSNGRNRSAHEVETAFLVLPYQSGSSALSRVPEILSRQLSVGNTGRN
ncbi:hypothetical protein H6P81_014232 [Aristolochia fimbriata]|uniref:Uncharacterized protein n=1 Tax=Aristolochia fimbriata TaxID=158543 RepID=A0AAV7EIG1_ARIFI|nr:hypothetical protein H6P81_014232 [Aristolochia fimbriata]